MLMIVNYKVCEAYLHCSWFQAVSCVSDITPQGSVVLSKHLSINNNTVELGLLNFFNISVNHYNMQIHLNLQFVQ